MKKLISVFLTLLLLTLIVTTPITSYAMPHGQHPPKMHCNKEMMKLKKLERRLWIEHVLWTHNYIVSDFAGLPEKDVVLKRLLRNQDDIGNSIKPFYGDEAGKQLAKLLREHILLAGQVITAAKNGNKVDFEKYNKQWYKNADDIAVFLAKANPNWSQELVRKMLYKHLEILTAEVTARINKDWKKTIEEVDKGEEHMIKFASILTHGIIKQFPEKFQ